MLPRLVRNPTMPTQDSVRLGNRRHLFQSLFTQPLAKLGECAALAGCELHPALNLCAEDPIFGDQIHVAQAEFRIDGTRGRGEQLLPVHVSSTLVIVSHWW